MKNPKAILPGKLPGQFILPVFCVTDSGLEDAGELLLEFCKGNKDNADDFRNRGLFTESVLMAAKLYLEGVNKGELASRETSMAITKLDEALLWIGKRAEDRKLREVQGTYKK